MTTVRGFLIGTVAGICLAVLAVFSYFWLGFAPVAVKAPAMPFEKLLAHRGLHVVRNRAATSAPPFQTTEARLLAGAKTYRSACAACHGLPGQSPTAIQRRMYPPAPALLSGKGVTDDPVGSTHWVVQNGIRLTGMPGFDGALPDDALWEVSLLLSRADQLPPAVRALLIEPIQTTSEAGVLPSTH